MMPYCRDMALIPIILLVSIFVPMEIGRVCEAKAASKLREDTAQLDFVRTDVARPFEDKQVLCENYLVKKGDFVWKILRERGHNSLGQLTHWSTVLKNLNPEVKDLDEIYVGQRLLIPIRYVTESTDQPPSPPPPTTTTYEVKPGETVSSILQHRFHLPESLTLSALSKVKELNPEIKDLNWIYPGQRLVIPLYGEEKEAKTDKPEAVVTKVAPQVVSAAKSSSVSEEEPQKREPGEQGHETGPTEVVVDVRRPVEVEVAAPVREQGAETPLKTRLATQTISPEDQRIQVLADAFMALAVAFGGRSQDSGRHFLPLKEEGQITLKAKSFPMLEFPTGERIFLDLHDRLPPSLEEAIKENWKGRYAVVNVTESDSFRTVWQRVMEKFTGMEQWLDRDPLLVHEPVPIAVQGDWVLRQSDPQHHDRKVFVVNLLTESGERTDLAMQSYLDSLGVRVIDVQLKGQLERARIIAPLDDRAFMPRSKPLIVGPISAIDAVAAFLNLLGQTYKRDASVPLYGDDLGEVSIIVRASYYFQRQGRTYLINSRTFSPSILSLLKEKDLNLLVVDSRWTYTQVFEALIRHLNLSSEKPYSFYVSSRDPMRNIRVNFPGEFVREGETRYLLTGMDVPTSLADFFARNGVRVLYYGSP